MAPSKPYKTYPVIHHASTIANALPESFSDSSYGEVTWHTLFSYPETPTSEMCAGLATCPPSTGHLCRHRHIQPEIYYITEGSGRVFIDGQTYSVSQGTVVYIPSDAEHGIVNDGTTPLKWFYVFPTGAFGDVVYRFSSDEKLKSKL